MRKSLGFVVLSDGPCSSKSFRPNDDETQWWSRRDALVRIVRAACGLDHHCPVDSLHVVFHDGVSKAASTAPQDSSNSSGGGGSESAEVGWSCIRPEKLKQSMLPICEKNLVRLWRASFGAAESSGARDSSTTDDSTRTGMKSFLFSELPLARKSAAAHLSGGALSKKDMINVMQRDGSIEFLRKHQLNRSFELAMKKLNKDAVEAAYQEFLVSTAETRSGSNAFRRCCEEIVKHAFSSLPLAGTKRGREEEPPSSLPRAAMIFFHEDYPFELPLFPSISEDGKEEEDGHTYDLLLCVLGAVRDVTPEELQVLQHTATQYGMDILGANLGRTAEFTSKIVASLVYHASGGFLHRAASRLRSLSLFRDGKGEEEGRLVKQASIRSGGRTWDGYTSRCVPCPMTSVSSPAVSPCLVVVAHVKAPLSTLSVDIHCREHWVDLVQLVVATLWRSRLASDVGEHSSPSSLATSLVLVFPQHHVLVLTQPVLAEQIALLHLAAPSEHQVLQLVLRLAQDPRCMHLGRPWEDVLGGLGPDLGLGLGGGKRFEGFGLVVVDCEGSEGLWAHSLDGRGGPGVQDLHDRVYRRVCGCKERAEAGESIAVLVVLGSYPHAAVSKVLYRWRYGGESKADGDRGERRERKRREKMARRCHDVRVSPLPGRGQRPGVSPAMAVIMLQHWVYHACLFPVLRELPATEEKG